MEQKSSQEIRTGMEAAGSEESKGEGRRRGGEVLTFVDAIAALTQLRSGSAVPSAIGALAADEFLWAD